MCGTRQLMNSEYLRVITAVLPATEGRRPFLSPNHGLGTHMTRSEAPASMLDRRPQLARGFVPTPFQMGRLVIRAQTREVHACERVKICCQLAGLGSWEAGELEGTCRTRILSSGATVCVQSITRKISRPAEGLTSLIKEVRRHDQERKRDYEANISARGLFVLLARCVDGFPRRGGRLGAC
jgi:hypothetical protein